MKAEKYPKINKLPSKARSIRMFAEETNVRPAYVYVKYERAQIGKTTVNYKIVNYQGINWVIPD